jgi:thioredoxin reductase
VDEAIEKGISVEELTGKPVSYCSIEDSTFQQMFALMKGGEGDKAEEMERGLDRA